MAAARKKAKASKKPSKKPKNQHGGRRAGAGRKKKPGGAIPFAWCVPSRLMERVDDYKRENEIPTRSQAVAELLGAGIKIQKELGQLTTFIEMFDTVTINVTLPTRITQSVKSIAEKTGRPRSRVMSTIVSRAFDEGVG